MDYRPIIESKYNRENWQRLLHDIFNGKEKFWATPSVVPTSSQFAKQALWLGTITLSDEQTIAIYEVELSDSVDIERNRRGIRDMLLTSWRNNGNAGAFMFCYRKDESVLRFSYVSESWNFADDGTYKKESTDTKRFTYLLGEGHRSRTAIQQFEKLRDSQLSLKDLTKAFSVEAVSDMFFNGYKKQYEDIIFYVTGKRMVKVANKWEERQEGQPCQYIMQQFSHFPNPEKSIRDYVKKLMGRLVFLQFLQKKGWLGVPVNAEWGEGDPEFILNLYESCNDKDHFIDNVLEALFNDLNSERTNDLVSSAVGSHIRVPYLNGGLFEREATDETEFPLPAKYMQSLLDFFASYNFTIDENDPDDAEVGVDPEMLGRIFENLLEDNKDKGAFYTPKEIVSYMCRESLIAYLQTGIEDETIKEAIRQFVTNHEKNDKLPADTDQKLKDVKICDPAIGSGAFPMGLLKELFQCRTALEGIDKSKAAEVKKHIIQQNIYGVDIEHGAVDIARLRFWLSLIVEEENPHALPNLDYKIVEGNSLITTFDGQYVNLSTNVSDFRRSSLFNIRPEKKVLQAEQKRFFTLCGDEKYCSEIAIKNHILNIIWYQLDYEKRSWQDATIEQGSLFGSIENESRKKNDAQVVEFTAERQEVLTKCEFLIDLLKDESKPLKERASITIPFFEWETVFSEVFEDENKKGFDIVIGNPPYIQLQNNGGELAQIYENRGYETLARTGDIYCLFYERGWQILKQGGHVCFITSNKWMRAGYGDKTRGFFANKTNPKLLIDFAGFKIFESATVDTNILLFSKSNNLKQTICAVADRQNNNCIKNLSDFVQKQHSVCEFTTSESWVILSPIEQSIKRKIEAVGKPLKDWDIQINYGIKTGFNEAFIISAEKRNEILANCKDQDERQRTAELIRPILRGRDIKRCGYDWANLFLIATFPSRHYDIEEYPALKDYLLSFGIERLEQTGKKYIVNGEEVKARKKTNNKWFETQDTISYWEDFNKQKIVWARLMRLTQSDIDAFPRFSIVPKDYMVVDSLCFFSGSDIEIIASALNSEYATWYFFNNVATLDNGGFQMRQQYVEEIPLPCLCSSDTGIDRTIYNAFGFSDEEISYIRKVIEERKKEILLSER